MTATAPTPASPATGGARVPSATAAPSRVHPIAQGGPWWRQGRSARSRLRPTVLVIAVLVAFIGGGWPTSASASPTRRAAPADLPATDPGVPGPNAVDELSYDLGDEAFQPEGFPARVELKAQVFAPQTIAATAPLVILQHGRHVPCANADGRLSGEWPCPAGIPEVPSYRGYAALGRNLASHGMVVVSIGANGINANDGYLDDGGAAARGELILEHLRRWQAWNASATGSPFGNRFVGKIDLATVGLMGHSRGGEGVVSAAQLNQRIGTPFGIDAVMALAPVDFGRRVLGGVPLGVILPYCDGDVSDLQGTSYYDDSRYASPGDPAPKNTTLLYGANHNFFNTVWTSGPGSFDDAGSFDGVAASEPARTNAAETMGTDPCRPGGPGRLAPAVQEQAGAVLMAGFLRRYLRADLGLQRFVTGTAPFPASAGPARWSVAFHAPQRLDVERYDRPDTARVNRFGRLAEVRAVSSGLVCNAQGPRFFELPTVGAAAATSTPCPDVTGLSATNDTGALDVGWVRPTAVVRQPLAAAGTDVTAYDGVRFRVAMVDDSRNATRPRQDLSVVLEDADGNRAAVPATAWTNALLPLTPSFVRHAVLNGVRIPTSAFGGVDLTRIRAVELRFDRTGAGRLAVSDLAFTTEGTGGAGGPTTGRPSAPSTRPTCRRTEAARWGCAVAQILWGRDPDSEELSWLSGGYGSAGGRRGVVALAVAVRPAGMLHGQRYLQAFAQGDPFGGDVEGLLSDAGLARWEAGIVELSGTLAYGTPALSTPTKVVVSEYQSLVGRSPDPAGLAYWSRRVERGGAGALASSLLRTASYRGRVVDERYRQILGREADPAGRAYWIGRLATVGGAEQAMVRTFMETESFRIAASS